MIKPTPENNDPKIEQDKHADEAMSDDTWLAISQDWQSQPVPKTDINALVKQTKRRTFWAKSYFGLNILATIWMLAEFTFGVFNGEFGDPANTFFGLGGGFSLIFIYYEYKIRLNTWSNFEHGPEQAIDHAISGCQSSLRYISLTFWSTFPFGAVGNWFSYSLAKQHDYSIWPGLIYVNFLVLSLLIGCAVFYRKRVKELKRLQQVKSD